MTTATGAVLGGQSAGPADLVTNPGCWSIQNQPAVNTVATATKPAVPGVRHICKHVSACLASTTGLAAAATGLLALRDGASGAGTVIAIWQLSIPNVLGQMAQITLTDLDIVGTAGNAMTLEFTAAAGAGTLETVTLSGYDAS